MIALPLGTAKNGPAALADRNSRTVAPSSGLPSLSLTTPLGSM
jgi:hypothetical protein